MKRLTHVDKHGRARMVDVSAKPATTRRAIARASVRMEPQTLALIQANGIAKGNVLQVAQLAGVMGAKRTADLIPLCHPIALTNVQVVARPDPAIPGVAIEASATTVGPTGVEMEALMAAAVAALTVYDMCKAVDRGMTVDAVRLVRKQGGRSGVYRRPGERR
jgi:cyclic pyranopterin phosphate synthase